MNYNFIQQYIKWSFITVVTFILLQCITSLNFVGDFLSLFGLVHVFLLVFYLTLAYLCLRSSFRVALLNILIYQLFFTLALYFYYSAHASPLGIGVPDAYFYDSLARESAEAGFYDSSEHDLGDLGFTKLTWFIYLLPGEPVLNMKLVNIFLHMLSGVLLYKTARVLDFSRKSAKFITILFCLNPASLYFNSSGLKEASFLFVVMLSIYLCYVAPIKKSLIYFSLSFISIVLTAFYRIPYPIFILIGFSFYFYGISAGKYKKIIKFLMILLVPIFGVILWSLIQSSMELWFALDLGKLQAHRLGKESVSIFDYILLFVVGIIGPIPSLKYEMTISSGLLLTLPNYIKMCLSGYFLISIYEVLKFREYTWYPLLIIFLINLTMLTIAASTFDIRYVYPIMPVFYLLVGRKLIRGFQLNSPFFIFHISLSSILIIMYNLR